MTFVYAVLALAILLLGISMLEWVFHISIALIKFLLLIGIAGIVIFCIVLLL